MKKSLPVFNRQIPNPIPLLTSFALLCTLFVMSTLNLSTAWFSRNKIVAANGMHMIATLPKSDSVTLEPYAISDISENVYTLSGQQSYTLPSHDPDGIIYNPHKKAIAVLIDVFFEAESDIMIVLQSQSTSITFGQNNVISNCMKISPATYDPTTRTATISNDAQAQSFVTIENDTATKTPSLTLYTGAAEAEQKLELCFIIEYNQDFLTTCTITQPCP